MKGLVVIFVVWAPMLLAARWDQVRPANDSWLSTQSTMEPGQDKVGSAKTSPPIRRPRPARDDNEQNTSPLPGGEGTEPGQDRMGTVKTSPPNRRPRPARDDDEQNTSSRPGDEGMEPGKDRMGTVKTPPPTRRPRPARDDDEQNKSSRPGDEGMEPGKDRMGTVKTSPPTRRPRPARDDDEQNKSSRPDGGGMEPWTGEESDWQSRLRSATDFLQNLSDRVSAVLQRLLTGGTTLVLDQLSKPDLRRFLNQFAKLPEELQNKLLDPEKFAHLDVDEIRKLPPLLVLALNESTLDIILGWSDTQREALCGTLMRVTSCPKNLHRVLEKGISCTDMVDLISRDVRRHASHSAVLLSRLKKDIPPGSWNKRQVSWVIEAFGDALSADDIDHIQEDTLAESLRNISRVRLPDKSLRRRLVSRLLSKYRSPTTWPNHFLEDMGRLLEDVDVQRLVLLRSDAVEEVATALTEAGISKGTTRIALTKVLSRGLRALPDAEKLKKLLPWIKSDVTLMSNIDMEDFLEAMKDNQNIEFTEAEAILLAERVEGIRGIVHVINNDTDHHLTVRKLIDGFSPEFLESLSDGTLKDILDFPGKPVKCRRRANWLMGKMKGRGRMPTKIPPWLYGGQSPTNIKEMVVDELEEVLPYIGRMPLPVYIGKNIVEKVLPSVMPSEIPSCHDIFHKLGDLSVHVRSETIHEKRLLPVSLTEDECTLDTNELKLTRAQIFAVMDNIKESLKETLSGTLADGDSMWSVDIISNIGVFARGLTADDIATFSLDTELLSIIEILAQYEDELDSSQVKAIAEKIRQYYNLKERNTLDDVDSVSVIQIGRFLQYLNPDFELPKFPRELRPAMVREMGRSSMMKIPLKKKQSLLKFALISMNIGPVSAITEDVLMDLGNLRCGLTKDQINRLTAEAISVHTEDLQGCPFQEDEAEALTQAALDFNLNLLRAREQLATMGPLLAYVPEKDKAMLDSKELASIGGYIARQMLARDLKIKSRRKRGFIRERSSMDEERREEHDKYLAMSLFYAMEREFGKSCHGVVRLDQTGAEFAMELDNEQLGRCVAHLNTLTWDSGTASSTLERVSAMLGIDVTASSEVSQNSELLLDALPNLLPGLPPEKFYDLNITLDDDVAKLGMVEGLSRQQMKTAFDNWRKSNDPGRQITRRDLWNFGNLLCGAPKEYVEEVISGHVIWRSLDIVGSINGCSKEVLRAFAYKLVLYLGENAEMWTLSDVAEMGNLLGGVEKGVLNTLSASQIQVIEPSVISAMPADHVKDFTADQLYTFSEAQASAVTAMQRSYMTEDQVQALGFVLESNNGARVNLSSWLSFLALFLAYLRLIVVCFI